MQKVELIKLRKLVEKEIKRRKRINELLTNELVKEYIELNNLKVKNLDSNNIREILEQILSSYEIKESNGIYVCTRAYYVYWNVCYEDTNYYSKEVAINSPNAEHKIYTDIETGKRIKANREDNEPFIKDFEQSNIVLNPSNTCKNDNNYDEVKFDFFNTALKEGQAKAKKLVLAKYPRI